MPQPISYLGTHTQLESLNEYRHRFVYNNGSFKEVLGEIVLHPGSPYEPMKSILETVMSSLLIKEQ